MQGQRSLSWTSSGVLIPCEESASNVFRQLFVAGTEREEKQQIRRLQLGRSILDVVADQARDLQKTLGSGDRDRLDQYFGSVRDLGAAAWPQHVAWEEHPRPHVDAPEPVDPTSSREYMEKVRLMYDLARLAFETDSTPLNRLSC